MTRVREPAVSGMFYPGDPGVLRQTVDQFLAEAEPEGPPPKAIIVPHAGYIYSGPVAASAYACLLPAGNHIHRVVLLGPSHRVPFFGLAVTDADGFRTPLGVVPVDREAVQDLLNLPQVTLLDAAHAMEHSLEVHLPFLQSVLPNFSLVPLVVGEASPGEVAQVLDEVWGGDETLIVVSSDLSHYHDYETARRMDAETSQRIAELTARPIDGEHACGARPINGLLRAARERGMHARVLDLRNSGDTAGPRDQVVGYGAYAVE